jgi:hypothetical protein
MSRHPDYFQVLVALDQLVNTLAGGYADETISSRAYRGKLKGRPRLARIINGLFFWQADHCREAYESELNRSQLPPELRSANDG